MQRPTMSQRHIPDAVKRAVWERDGGRCTFVSEAGHRCPARELIEFDHIDEVARGGEATVDNIRLRCRAHNAYEGELFYGHGRPTRPSERRTLPGKSSPTPPP